MPIPSSQAGACEGGVVAALCLRTPGRFALLGTLIAFLTICSAAQAHSADTSYLRAIVSQHSLDLRFTFDLATLYRIARLDADQDGKVTRGEAEAAAPQIAEVLNQAVLLELNGLKASLGAFQSLGWPVDAGDVVEEKNYGQTLVHFNFRQDSPRLLEDIYVLYELFPLLGSQHRAVADFEQESKHLEVVFTEIEPDYVYDTFWRPDKDADTVEPHVLFSQGVRVAWTITGIPLMLLAVALLLPRKIPVVVMLCALGWFTWDFLGRLQGMKRNLKISSLQPELVTSGFVAACLICALATIPLLAFLRRFPKRWWMITACWIVLVWGALDVTGRVFICRFGSG